MTTPVLPDFIFNIYHNELVNIINKVTSVISSDFDIPKKDIQKSLSKAFETKLDLITEDEERIKIVKIKPRKLPADHERCQYMMKGKDGIERQCTLRKYGVKHQIANDDCMFCGRHMKK